MQVTRAQTAYIRVLLSFEVVSHTHAVVFGRDLGAGSSRTNDLGPSTLILAFR